MKAGLFQSGHLFAYGQNPFFPAVLGFLCHYVIERHSISHLICTAL